MIRPVLLYDEAAFRRLADAPENLLPRFQETLRRGFPRLRSQVLDIAYVIPGPPQYLIRWKSRKQELAFFRTGGFGRGIPTGRVAEPGGVLGAYDVTLDITATDGSIALSNEYPNAVFILGEHQQPFHVDTGWVNIDTTVQQSLAPVDDFVTKSYFDAALDVIGA